MDLHVPRDIPAGTYTGTATVTAGEQTLAELSLDLTVWDFDIPDERGMATAYGFSFNNLPKYHGGPDGGTPEYQDADSDGDNILDADEAGDTDPSTPPVDTDMDGIPDFQDTDSDNDSLMDVQEAGDSSVDSTPVDTDEDGVPDFRDLDSDNDYLSDFEEAGLSTDPDEAGTDDDTVSDLIEVVAGTDPNNPDDNPEANGTAVVWWEHGETADPTMVSLCHTAGTNPGLMTISVVAADDPSTASLDESTLVTGAVPNTTHPDASAGLTVAGDTYTNVHTGDVVCYDVSYVSNTSEPSTMDPQVFSIRMRFLIDGTTEAGVQPIYLIVPPTPL